MMRADLVAVVLLPHLKQLALDGTAPFASVTSLYISSPVCMYNIVVISLTLIKIILTHFFSSELSSKRAPSCLYKVVRADLKSGPILH
jgi:hypothetical protein